MNYEEGQPYIQSRHYRRVFKKDRRYKFGRMIGKYRENS